ncbi:uncharacterized protein LOC114125782 [Aphis gossypii]|uniref:Uncharacterized protein n=1 Tax=Aphis gossypii TaxID=80765 RepID=A0A9P0NH27_APHGO|nr:uncharacterized protein LOC114125782 [Aphis gossypii]XP_050057104.1 uncharacterized protein LOC114125782 [Aphis gossypii]CAH1720750.1 unnamed protein product [Aphis gossypii]
MAANRNGESCSSDDDDDEDDEDEDSSGSCSSCSTAEADDDAATRRRLSSGRATTVVAATSLDLLDARRLPDLLDAERLVAVLDGCLRSEYVRGCVVETWDAVLSDHLEAIAHLVLYQTPEHAVSQAVYEQLVGLSATLRPPPDDDDDTPRQQRRPARVDAERVYGTLRSAAQSLLTTRVDACCRQSMCRAVGLAVAALRCSTRPVFSVENFVVEINEAANFANLYCTGYAKRICAALEGIYDTVMAGDYHPTNVVVQMAVMDKCIKAALRTLADARATAAQKTAAQRSLLAELDDVGATVRMKNYGCVDDADPQQQLRRLDAVATAASPARFVHFTMSPWRAPIRMYHQQSPTSVDRVIRTTVHLIEALVAELFKPCLNGRHGVRRRRRHRACSSRQVHDKQL